MSKRAEDAARQAYPFSEGKVQSSFGTISFDQHHDAREGFIKGYESAEKDIWNKIEKYLSRQDPGNYATAGFILKNFEYFKQQIMEEEHPKF